MSQFSQPSSPHGKPGKLTNFESLKSTINVLWIHEKGKIKINIWSNTQLDLCIEMLFSALQYLH